MFISRDNKKIFWQWWLIAAIVYLVIAGVITWHYGTNFLMPLNDDTAHHIQLAKNLINYRTFSLDGLDGKYETLPPKPTNFLTPGYALWLALIYLIFKSFIPAIFIGAIIFALSAPLMYLLAQEITGSDKIAFWSAFIFIFEPLSVYHSGLLFTEQIFVPLFLAGVYGFIKYFKNGGLNLLALSLIAFSFATLIRPAIFYFLPALVLIVIFKEFKISIKRALILGIISIILAYSIIGIWLIRNKIVLNTWQVSSNTGAILFGYHYEPLTRSLGLKPESQKILGGGRDIFSVEYNKKLGEFAIKEILNHKPAYFKMRLVYFPLFFVSNGYDNIVSRLTGSEGFDKYFRWDLVSSFQKGDILLGVKKLFNAPKTITAILSGALFWFLVSLSAIIGFWRLLKERENLIVMFIGLLIVYFAFVTTPLINARYRLPINSFIFIFAVSGFYFFKEKLKQWI
ncbi:MAG: phospholipid carrier-dependent glycosyltransferase [Candidatus Falkowbacteria bacterium]